jgi:hypothetical protein
MREYMLKDWRIVAEKGEGVCLLGFIFGIEGQIQTTTLTEIQKVSDERWNIKTRSGTIYALYKNQMNMSLWPLSLQMKRPEKYASLQKHGIVP